VCDLLKTTAASIWLVEPGTGELVCQQAFGPHSDLVRDWRLAPGQGIAGYVSSTGSSVVVPDTRINKRHFKRVDQKAGVEYRSILSVPLQAKDQVIGALQVMTPEPDRFGVADLTLVKSLASPAAVAIENARLYTETLKLKAFNEKIVNSINESIVIEDAAGRITFVNPKGAEIIGYTVEDLIGQPISVGVAPEEIEKVDAETIKRPQRIASQYETVLQTRTGEKIPVLVSARPLFENEQFAGVLSVFTDIRKIKQAEAEIDRRAKQQGALNAIIAAAATATNLQDLLEAALSHTLQALDADIGSIWVGERAAYRGVSEQDWRRYTNWMESSIGCSSRPMAIDDIAVVDPHQMPPPLDGRALLIAPVVAKSEPIGWLSWGARRAREWSAAEIELAETIGQQLGVVVERLRLLKQVQDQAEQMQQIVDTVPTSMFLLDKELRVLIANSMAREHLKSLCRLTEECALTQLGQRPIEEILQPPPHGFWHEIETDASTSQIFEAIACPVKSEVNPEGWVLMIRDVTLERAIEERARQQERLAVVGQLAAGIAHDFNNILSVIVLHSQMTLLDKDLPLSFHERVRAISEQAKRATALVQQILDFSRASTIESQPINLPAYLKELIQLLKRTIPEHIDIKLTYGRGAYVIHADPTRIQQAIMNLVMNAYQAMPQGGELIIALQHLAETANSPLPLTEMQPGPWIEISVADTGTGISPDVLPHIFNPFFTTKGPDEGIGLGLAQVHGIVAQHGGHVTVESQVGVGTIFHIYLPTFQEPSENPREYDVIPPMPGRGEKILVIEDAPATRQAIVTALRILKYQVLTAANGEEAIQQYRQHHEEIGLILTDLVMPGMNGPEMIDILKRDDPQVKIIVMTGYPKSMAPSELLEQRVDAWLVKPLDIKILSKTIQDILKPP